MAETSSEAEIDERIERCAHGKDDAHGQQRQTHDVAHDLGAAALAEVHVPADGRGEYERGQHPQQRRHDAHIRADGLCQLHVREAEHPRERAAHLHKVREVEHHPADAHDHHAQQPAQRLRQALEILAQPELFDQQQHTVVQAPEQEVPVRAVP